jgi:hypothetical protein
MVPLHTWLPDAHVEAPTTGSVILAGVLLKMGTYGFIKLGFPLFPEASQLAMPAVMALAVVSIVYGACLALVQTDIKKIIAYSSISHLGYVMLGLASLDLIGIQGAIIQMVSHGLTAAGLFLMVGMIYERCHTRELAAYGGLAKVLPVYSVFFMILTLAAIGLPTTSGFTGEFLVLLGAFNAAWPQHLAGDSMPLALGGRSRSPAWCSARCTCCGSRSASSTARPRCRTGRCGSEPAREADPRRAAGAGVLDRPAPGEPMSKTENAALHFQKLVAGQPPRPPRRPRRRRLAAAPPGGDAMNWTTLLVAMAPEHLLLAGMVVLLCIDIVSDRPRGHLPVALVAVIGATLAAALLAIAGYAAAPFPGQLSVDSSAFAAKAIVLALAIPGAAAGPRRVSRRAVLRAAAVVAVRRLPDPVRRQLPDAVPRARADVDPGLRAGAAGESGGSNAPRRR